MRREPIAACPFCGHRVYLPARGLPVCHTCDLFAAADLGNLP